MTAAVRLKARTYLPALAASPSCNLDYLSPSGLRLQTMELVWTRQILARNGDFLARLTHTVLDQNILLVHGIRCPTR